MPMGASHLTNATPISFAGHESFTLRHTWLTKGVRHCFADPGVFNQKNSMAVLGVGKNMVRSIRHWCLASQMLEEDPAMSNNRGRRLRATTLGERIFVGEDAWDPYLEDTGTLWLLHWLISTNKRYATTWHFAFGQVHRPEFTKAWLEDELVNYAGKTPGARATRGTIRRDVEAFLRTYVRPKRGVGIGEIPEESLDCPLVDLGLIRELADEGSYAFNRGPKKSLPDEVFVYALNDYARGLGGETVSFYDLAYGQDSPGRVFKLDEPSLGERLERIHDLSDGAIQFNETAGLKELIYSRHLEGIDLLKGYYVSYAEAVRRSRG